MRRFHLGVPRVPRGRLSTVLLLSLSFAAALVPGAAATTYELLSGEELTEQASLIVVGHCSAVATEWWGKALVTRYTISVEEGLKGQAPAALSLFVPGGVDLDRDIPVTVTYPGAPGFVEGERAVLFLESLSGPSGYGIVGFSQGKLPVVSDAAGTSFVYLGQSGRARRLDLARVTAAVRALAASLPDYR